MVGKTAFLGVSNEDLEETAKAEADRVALSVFFGSRFSFRLFFFSDCRFILRNSCNSVLR